MNRFVRLAIVIFVVLVLFQVTSWMLFLLVQFEIPTSISLILSIAAAGIGGWLVWDRTSGAPTASSTAAISSVLKGAVIVGGIGFTLGFFGPLIFAPDANQGPLLGIFVTGPLGVVVGAIGGFVHWLVTGRERTYR